MFVTTRTKEVRPALAFRGFFFFVERFSAADELAAFAYSRAVDSVAGFEVALGFGGEARPWDGFETGRVDAFSGGFADSVTTRPYAVQGVLDFEQGLLF